MKKFLKQNWFGVITSILSLTILLFAVSKTGGVRNLLITLSDANLTWLLIGLIFIVIFWLLDGLLLRDFVRMRVIDYRYKPSLKIAMIGLLYSALTPFAVGGQPMQVYLMGKEGIEEGDAVCNNGEIYSISNKYDDICNNSSFIVFFIFY